MNDIFLKRTTVFSWAKLLDCDVLVEGDEKRKEKKERKKGTAENH